MAKSNQTGQLKHRVTIQYKKKTKNSYGEETVSWIDDAVCWAAIWPVRGMEYFAAQQIHSAVSHKIRMRYRTLSNETSLNSNCRIKFGDRYFEIQSTIDVDEGHIWLDLMCVEAINAA